MKRVVNYFSKILVIQADLAKWAAPCLWLKEAGYTVFQAGNGRSALELNEQELPHLIIIDHAFPEDSYALCQMIKDQPTAISPVILLATHDIEAMPETEAIDNFLTHPINKRQLLLHVTLVGRLALAETERELLLNIATSIHTDPANNTLLPTVLSELQLLFFANSIGFTTIDKESGDPIITEAYGNLAHLAGQRVPNGKSGLHRLLQSETPVLIENVASWQQKYGVDMQTSNLGGTISFAAVPLRNKETKFGVLWLGSTRKIKPSLNRFLAAIASLLTTALQQELWMNELQQANNELEAHVAERTEELSLAYARLQELDKMKSNFVANVSHELRLPISNLMLYLDLLKKGNANKRADYEAQLSLSTNRLYTLVDDILNLSRLEAQMDEAPKLPVDLNTMISEVIAIVSASISTKPVTIHFQPEENLPPVLGRQGRLSQVITNLLNNAVKHTNEGQITVQAVFQAKEEIVCFTVTDTGMGILPEDIPNIFNRFYRGRQSVRNQVPGSGLGLSIVREIIEQHNGRISVKSVFGKGSTFTVCLPAVIF